MSSGPLTNSSTLSTNGALGIPRGFVYLLVSIHLHTDRIRDILSFRLCHGRQASRKAKCVADDQSLVIFKSSKFPKTKSLLHRRPRHHPPPTVYIPNPSPMRPTPLLRQLAANSTPQTKLPLPQIFPSGPVPRLRPAKANFLPSLVNAPTTLPPVLIPPPKVELNGFMNFPLPKIYYYRWRSYYTFYKAGIKQVFANQRIRKVLKQELMKEFNHIQIPGSANIVMTRSEFQMLIRTKRDVRKMPCIRPFPRGVELTLGDSFWARQRNFCGNYSSSHYVVWSLVSSGDVSYGAPIRQSKTKKNRSEEHTSEL